MKQLLNLLLLLTSLTSFGQIIPYDSSIERSTINFSLTATSNGLYYSPSFQKIFSDKNTKLEGIVRTGVDLKFFNSDLDYLNQHRFYLQVFLARKIGVDSKIGLIPMWYEAPLPKPSYETYGGVLPDGTVIRGDNEHFFGYWTPTSLLFNTRFPFSNKNLCYEIQVDHYWNSNTIFRFRILYEVAYLKGI